MPARMNASPACIAILVTLVAACGSVQSDPEDPDGGVSARPDASPATEPDGASRPTIEASELSGQLLWIEGQGDPFSSSAPHLVDLPAGDYELTSYSTGNDIGR